MESLEVLKEMFNKLYSLENRKEIERIILNLKSDIENQAGVNAFVTGRIKQPISILKKFQTNPVYATAWNRMKDLIGLTVVVDSNNDVDDLIFVFTNEYSDYKNPNSESIFKDYRIIDIRSDKEHKASMHQDLPSEKGYQTGDGYKNVRANLMINGYPIEIQIKTKEQWVAHGATHDPIYKTDELSENKVKQEISDKLFPFFEASAHYMLHSKEMSKREIANWRSDVFDIIKRNGDFYRKYESIYKNARKVYAYNLFMVNNMKEIYQDVSFQVYTHNIYNENEEFVIKDDSKKKSFSNNLLDLKVLEIELKRLFHILENEVAEKDPSLTSEEVVDIVIDKISNMSYKEFKRRRDMMNRKNDHRCYKAVVSGVYDMLRAQDVEVFDRLSKNFKYVNVAVYDDELVELFTGEKPMFNLEQRLATLRKIKGISSVFKINLSGEMKPCDHVQFLTQGLYDQNKYDLYWLPKTVEELKDKKIVSKQVTEKYFDIGYLPGVFDMLHPGHIAYISKVCKLCKKVYVSAKTNEYVLEKKGKIPVLNQEERAKILGSIRGLQTDFDIRNHKKTGLEIVQFDGDDDFEINEVEQKSMMTAQDITPPPEIMDIFLEAAYNNEKCVIFMGSDWVEKTEKKQNSSLNEYTLLNRKYPNIRLVSVPRENNGLSSTKFSGDGRERLNDINPYEFTFFDK